MNRTDTDAQRRDQVLWMLTGVMVGVALWLALDQVALLALGLVLGLVLQEQAKKDARKRRHEGAAYSDVSV